MKLHTDFHDYYDTAVGYGRDSKVYYNRFTREVKKRFKPKLDFPRAFWDAIPFLLGFCGEIYPILRIAKRDSNNQAVEFFYAYNYEELTDKRKEWVKSKGGVAYYTDKRREIETKQFFGFAQKFKIYCINFSFYE